jgi:hypothetical protein
MRQVLFDDWTWRERLIDSAAKTYATTRKWLSDLGWWNAAFWPALTWVVAILVALGTWVFAPSRLAHWAMPAPVRAEPPGWKWLSDMLLLFGWLGATPRPLEAWLRRHRAALVRQAFTGRHPVQDRQAYAELDHRAEIERLAAALAGRKDVLMWITGDGGAGKSALGYQILRAAERARSAPLPVLVDEDWSGSLAEHIAAQLRLGGRQPTPAMVKVLGARNRLCPLIDQLSERGAARAVDSVADAIRSGNFRSLLVTSRRAKPAGEVWEKFETVQVQPLSEGQVPDYVAEYAPADRCPEILGKIAPLIRNRVALSPLFLRFAVEQALAGELTAVTTRDLVLHYVEALRKDRVDLNEDDMRRAAGITATEAVRETLVPREIDPEYLRGVLVTAADKLPFLDSRREQAVNPAAVLDRLIDSGLITRNQINRNLQFAYDPVAEQLYARRAEQAAATHDIVPLRDRIAAAPDTALARAVAAQAELALSG